MGEVKGIYVIYEEHITTCITRRYMSDRTIIDVYCNGHIISNESMIIRPPICVDTCPILNSSITG